MTDFERAVAEALAAPCGCPEEMVGTLGGYYPVSTTLRDCPECLPKRIVWAIEKAEWATMDSALDHFVSGCGAIVEDAKVQGAALAALRGEEG